MPTRSTGSEHSRIVGDRLRAGHGPIGQSANFTGVVNVLRPSGDPAGAVVPVEETRDKLIEAIIEADEKVMERYFEGVIPSSNWHNSCRVPSRPVH